VLFGNLIFSVGLWPYWDGQPFAVGCLAGL
jgi:hypothetical protein